MNVLLLDPTYPIGMKPIDPTRRDSVGGGALALTDQWQRPMNEYTIRCSQNDIAGAEALYAFYLRHRGATPFLFDGAGRCEITVPQLFFVGDGVTAEFMLPFANIIIPTWVWYLNEAFYTDWEMEESGLFIPGDPPAVSAQLKGKGRWMAQCVFWGDGESLFTSEEFAFRLFNEGITIREVP